VAVAAIGKGSHAVVFQHVMFNAAQDLAYYFAHLAQIPARAASGISRL
jgi:hypothetical protein